MLLGFFHFFVSCWENVTVNALEDGLELFEAPTLQKFVSLVQHEERKSTAYAMTKIATFVLLNEFPETTWGTDKNMWGTVENTLLLFRRHSTHDAAEPDTRSSCHEGLEGISNLERQLASWADDECVHDSWCRLGRLLVGWHNIIVSGLL